MGIETQAVLGGHYAIEDLQRRLEANYPAAQVRRRATHKPDYWLIEFVDRDGQRRVVNVFLNSYAADDYAELDTAESTLITAQLEPTSDAIIKAISAESIGWFRRRDGDPWVALPLP